MPPQLLSKVNPRASFTLLPLVEQRPEVAIEIARRVTAWAQAEHALSQLFLVLLGANEVVGSQLFNSFESTTAKMSSLRAVSITSILPHERELFENLIRSIKSKEKIRDRIVHWLWGVSSDFEDGLILIDPKDVLNRHASYMDLSTRHFALSQDQLLSEGEVYIYRIDDLKRDVRDFEDITTTIYLAQKLFMTPKDDVKREAISTQLSNRL